MYTIVMDKYKDLNTTVRSVIYKGENMVDKIQFLIPQKYDGNAGRESINPDTGETELIQDGVIDISNYTVTLKYVDPNGNFHSEVLARDDELYKDYYRYTLPVETAFTQVAGTVTVRLTLTYFDHARENLEKMESNSTTVRIEKPQGFDDYVNFEDIAAWKHEMAKMNEEITDLQNRTPDDLMINDEDDKLHLSHEGVPMGDGVDVMVPATSDDDGNRNGVIEVDEVPEDEAEAYVDGDIQFYEV